MNDDDRAPLQDARRSRLLAVLARDGVVRVTDLAERLAVSTVTVRRDLAQLAEEGLVRRVHGGAGLADGAALPDRAGLSGAAGVSGAAGHVGQVAAGAPARTGQAIGMLVPTLDYYWPDIVRGAEEAARERHLRLRLRGSSYEAFDDRPQLERFLSHDDAAGLLVALRPDSATSAPTLEWLAGSGLPVVLVERSATVGAHHAVMESVISDHVLGGAMAVRHLASLGHRKVGLLLSGGSPTGPHIRQGWLQASAECGLDPASTVDVRLPSARDELERALDDVLDTCLSTGTTAVLVHADTEAMALVQRCELRELSVPGDLSLVAYDDEVAGLFSPPLTAIRPPRRSLGRAAFELVAARLADPGRPAHRVVISPSLRVRESSAPPRA